MTDHVSAPYWEGLQQGELRIQRCLDCAALRHYPQLMCPACHSFSWDTVVVEGVGKVHSWTVAHVSFVPGDPVPVPYALVTVQLREGVRVLARCQQFETLSLGQRVRVVVGPGGAGPSKPVLIAELD